MQIRTFPPFKEEMKNSPLFKRGGFCPDYSGQKTGCVKILGIVQTHTVKIISNLRASLLSYNMNFQLRPYGNK